MNSLNGISQFMNFGRNSWAVAPFDILFGKTIDGRVVNRPAEDIDYIMQCRRNLAREQLSEMDKRRREFPNL